MAAYRARLKEFDDCLSMDVIDMKKLRKLCFAGCPFEAGRRSTCWKLLLGYLPQKRSEWTSHLKQKRDVYRQFIEEMIIKPGADAPQGVITDVTFDDHPLNPSPNSQWKAFFKDNEMLLQIDKDCRRLCPDLSFFQQATAFPCDELVNPKSNVETLRKRVEHTVLKSETVETNRLGITRNIIKKKRTNDAYVVLLEGEEAHWEVVERILFIYAKLNPGLAYVQGMNEILGPLYYSFSSDPVKECREHAEADTFFCFTNLMAEIRDNFLKSLDDADCGIGGQMCQLTTMLADKDPHLSRRITQQELRPQYYAFRWLTLLLSQEFPLPDVLRIWDTLFADERRFNFLINISCAMLILVRSQLLDGDFSHNMKLVQNFPYTSVEIQVVIAKAVELNDR